MIWFGPNPAGGGGQNMSRTIIWVKLSSVWTGVSRSERHQLPAATLICSYCGWSWEGKSEHIGNIPAPLLPPPSWQTGGGSVPSWQSSRASCSDLELAGFGHVLDAFERFVLFSIHVQPVYLQSCGATQMSETPSTPPSICHIKIKTRLNLQTLLKSRPKKMLLEKELICVIETHQLPK